MQSISSHKSIVVSNIQSNGTYVRSIDDYIKDNIIADGGCYDFVQLWNRFGHNVKFSEREITIIVVPTERVMAMLSERGVIDRSIFSSKNETEESLLRVVFDLSVGKLDVKFDKVKKTNIDLNISNDQNHPISVKWENVPVSILDVTTNTRIKVVKYERREYRSNVIYFLYISGIILNTEASKVIIKE
jgi:hypothetical protein